MTNSADRQASGLIFPEKFHPVMIVLIFFIMIILSGSHQAMASEHDEFEVIGFRGQISLKRGSEVFYVTPGFLIRSKDLLGAQSDTELQLKAFDNAVYTLNGPFTGVAGDLISRGKTSAGILDFVRNAMGSLARRPLRAMGATRNYLVRFPSSELSGTVTKSGFDSLCDSLRANIRESGLTDSPDEKCGAALLEIESILSEKGSGLGDDERALVRSVALRDLGYGLSAAESLLDYGRSLWNDTRESRTRALEILDSVYLFLIPVRVSTTIQVSRKGSSFEPDSMTELMPGDRVKFRCSSERPLNWWLFYYHGSQKNLGRPLVVRSDSSEFEPTDGRGRELSVEVEDKPDAEGFIIVASLRRNTDCFEADFTDLQAMISSSRNAYAKNAEGYENLCINFQTR